VIRSGAESGALLLETDEPEVVTAVRHALTAAGIPYDAGLRSDREASVALFVPWQRLDEAREIVRQCRDDGIDDAEDEPSAEGFCTTAQRHCARDEVRETRAVYRLRRSASG